MQNKFNKAKLPRKRKKRAIKVQGRDWYYNTIRLYKITQQSGMFFEPTCKFWVNNSIVMTPRQLSNSTPVLIQTPTKYW